MRCIFCLEERPPSEEHVFPDAIGGKLTINRVCKPCNDTLGSTVDKLVTEHGLVIMRRHQLGMIDSRGKTVSPFGTLFRRATIGEAPGLPFELIADPNTGHITHRVLYHREERKGEDGSGTIHVTIDASRIEEVPKIIMRERSRAGLPALSAAELAERVASVVASVRTIDRPSVLLRPAFDAEQFRRGLLKIAYELTWYWLGDDYLTDPTAVVLRRAVLNGDMTGVIGTVLLGVAQPAFAPWMAHRDSHMGLGVCSPDGRSMASAVRIFDVLSAVFQVTADASRYPAAPRGGFIMTGPGTPGVRQSSFHEAVVKAVDAGARAPATWRP